MVGGADYISDEVKTNMYLLEHEILDIMANFKVVSFDNLALEQLDIKKYVSDKVWEQSYMGDDGQYTMYVDLVEEKYARSSTSNEKYKLKDDIQDMFNSIKKSV